MSRSVKDIPGLETWSHSPRTALSRAGLFASLFAAMAIGVACGDSPQSQPATIPVATAGAAVSTSGGSGATQSLSANNASISELAAAFEAAGIRSASRWAREVDEYRPYSVDDADYAKLRGELAKYNPAPGVVDQIISLLHLP